MTPIALFILAAIVVEWLLELAADALNLRALEPEQPPEAGELYDADTYRRSQEYVRARTRFGLVPQTVHLVAFLAFWALGGFGQADELARSAGLGPVGTGLVFIGLLMVLRALLSLPFRIWSTFVIEERFGFNRTTWKTFLADGVKGIVLGALLGGPLLAGVLWLLGEAGPLAWVWCWALTTAFTIAVQFVAPTWIFPLFNRFQPVDDEELEQAILRYTERVGFPLRGLFVIDGSRRSTKGNAFFTGFGSNKRIALFDTLVEKHGTEELVAVVAHEVGHYKRGHIVKGLVLGILHTGVLFFLLSLCLGYAPLFEAFGVDGRPVYAGLVFFGILYRPVELILGVALQALSRRHEFEADRFAAETTGRPEDLASALRGLSRDNLANLTPHPFYVALHHSHPPLLERLAALGRFEERPGGRQAEPSA